MAASSRSWDFNTTNVATENEVTPQSRKRFHDSKNSPPPQWTANFNNHNVSNGGLTEMATVEKELLSPLHLGQNTLQQTTFGMDTVDAFPSAFNYSVLAENDALRKRPTLLELSVYGIEQEAKEKEKIEKLDSLDSSSDQGKIPSEESRPVPEVDIIEHDIIKFGWIKGVLVRCVLNIFGVMLFLRLAWMFGQAGIILSSIIILLATLVTTITAMSMSAICTNGEVKGGGVYYMISRSLGPEFGGAIGLVFSFANACGASLHTVGFAETVRDLMKSYGAKIVDGGTNDIRIIGVATVVILLTIAMIGMEWEVKTQVGLLVILTVAIVNFIVGVLIPPTDIKQREGFIGFQAAHIGENFKPAFEPEYSFIKIFAIFFPAATGILAGANISGNLKDPSAAIPKGTFLAIAITSGTYMLMGWLAALTGVRTYFDCSEAAHSLDNGNFTDNMTTISATTTPTHLYTLVHTLTTAMVSGNKSNETVVDATLTACRKTGLLHNFQIMQVMSGWWPLIIAGIFCATLSSALACIVSAPKLFEAVCRDDIYPGINWFGKQYGRNKEPYRAYILGAAIAIGFVLIGDLNTVAPLMSNFFLASYCLINYSCFDATMAKTPGWRPAFRYYNAWVSLIGTGLCLACMFIMNWWCALVTIIVVFFLYFYNTYKKPDVNWGSSTQAHSFKNALTNAIKLIAVSDHVKNFRPQILLLSGLPIDRPALVDFANCITKHFGVLICGHVFQGDTNKLQDQRKLQRLVQKHLQRWKVHGFYMPVVAPSMRQGVQALMQCGGLGKLRPNTIMLGFKSNWQYCDPQELIEYYQTIQDAFSLLYGVGIFRVEDGFDFSHLSHLISGNLSKKNGKEKFMSSDTLNTTQSVLGASQSSMSISQQANGAQPILFRKLHGSEPDIGHTSSMQNSTNLTGIPTRLRAFSFNSTLSVVEGLDSVSLVSTNHETDQALRLMNQFKIKQPKGTIDVWWLFDDGGLTIMVPHLLSQKKLWRNCKMRVFGAGTKPSELEKEQKNLASLLTKFRIFSSDVIIVPTVGMKPAESSICEFEDLISDMMLQSDETEETHPHKISKEEIQRMKDKTYRKIRIRELLQQHSSNASLIVLTLPVPKQKFNASAGLYMAWLETLTKGMPPILLLRGNQESVLTFYS